MSSTDIIALIVTIIGVASFATVVTILFRNYIRSQIKEINLGNRDIEIVDLMIYERDPKVIKKRKADSIAKTVIYYAFLAIVIPVFGLSLYSRIKNNVTKFGDNFVMVVASGSMAQRNEANTYLDEHNLNNQFNTYDLIVLTGVNSSSQLTLYDVIAYKNDKNINVIHRIIAIDYSEGEVRYTTRGDSNSATDTYHPKVSDVIGKYTGKKIPGIGIFIMFFQSYAGIVTILSVVYCSFMISHFTKKMDDATEERKTLLEQLFDVTEMTESDPQIMSLKQHNVIFYKGYAYTLDPEGQPDKREMTEEEKAQYGVCEQLVTADKAEEKAENAEEQKENLEENTNNEVGEQGE